MKIIRGKCSYRSGDEAVIGGEQGSRVESLYRSKSKSTGREGRMCVWNGEEKTEE